MDSPFQNEPLSGHRENPNFARKPRAPQYSSFFQYSQNARAPHLHHRRREPRKHPKYNTKPKKSKYLCGTPDNFTFTAIFLWIWAHFLRLHRKKPGFAGLRFRSGPIANPRVCAVAAPHPSNPLRGSRGRAPPCLCGSAPRTAQQHLQHLKRENKTPIYCTHIWRSCQAGLFLQQ
jgi:hypothetical protein